MDTKRVSALLVLSLMVIAVACVSETKTRGTDSLVWKGGAAIPATPGKPRPKEAEPAPSSGRVVHVPKSVMDEIMAFVNQERMLLADRIEVDASRIPFRVAMVPVIDPSFVEKLALVAPQLKATGMLLRSRVDRPMVVTDLPKLRVGDGLDLVATREIQVRTYSQVDERRPVFIRIRGLGNAVYRDVETGKRLERDVITVQAFAVSQGGRMVFRHTVD